MPSNTLRFLSWGGVGDVILTTPVFRAIKKNDPSGKIVVYCLTKGHRDVYKHNPHIDLVKMATVPAYLLHFVKTRFRKVRFTQLNYGRYYPSISYDKSAVDIMGEIAGVTIKDKRPELFLTSSEKEAAAKTLEKFSTPVILHISSLTSGNQEWQMENWAELIKEMPDCSFIQLGLAKEKLAPGAIDFRGKTSLREALALIDAAKGFAGVNSVFSHAAAAFHTPAVVLFGPSQPSVWGHACNINIYKKRRCSPCIDLIESAECPYDKACMKDISVAEVRSALRAVLKNKNLQNYGVYKK